MENIPIINQLIFVKGLGMNSPIDSGLIVSINFVIVVIISASIPRQSACTIMYDS